MEASSPARSLPPFMGRGFARNRTGKPRLYAKAIHPPARGVFEFCMYLVFGIFMVFVLYLETGIRHLGYFFHAPI